MDLVWYLPANFIGVLTWEGVKPQNDVFNTAIIVRALYSGNDCPIVENLHHQSFRIIQRILDNILSLPCLGIVEDSEIALADAHHGL